MAANIEGSESLSDFRVRVIVVIGTRPEAIKLFPVIRALRESPHLTPFVVITGQHADMVLPVLKMAGIEPDVDLHVGRPKNTLNGLVADVVTAFDRLTGELRANDPQRDIPITAACLVHGDTTSAFAAALAAVQVGLPVVHVEAGLRTGDALSPFPEELNRQMIGRIASFHLAPTTHNLQNLVREKIPANRIFVTGNTGIDALRWVALQHVDYQDPRLEEFDAQEGPIIVVTAHRRENWDGGLGRIARAVAAIARARPDVRTVVSLHPNPRVRDEIVPWLTGFDNILLVEPLGYAEFARLLLRAKLAITDSGGIQEEAPSLDTPVLVVRDETERGEGVEAGTLLLVGTDTDTIVKQTLRLLDDQDAYLEMQRARNPYGDGWAAQRIVGALENLAVGTPPPQEFGSGFSRNAVLEAAGYGDLHGSPAEYVEVKLPLGERRRETRDRRAGGRDDRRAGTHRDVFGVQQRSGEPSADRADEDQEWWANN